MPSKDPAVLARAQQKYRAKRGRRACAHCGAQFLPWSERGRYCSRSCAAANNGGQRIRKEGEWWLNATGYVIGLVRVEGKLVMLLQHRLIAEQKLGRALRRDECVHHINEIRTDNRPENLAVMTQAEHTREHSLSRVHPRGYKQKLNPDQIAKRVASERANRTKRIAGIRAYWAAQKLQAKENRT